MKCNPRNSPIVFAIAAVVAAVIAATPPPASASVLCIAPGCHVAIEDINAGCCAHTVIPAAAEGPQPQELGSAGDCGNCVDFLLTTNRPGVISESIGKGSNLSSGVCFGRYLPPDIVFSPEFGLGANSCVGARLPLPSATPLRC